MRSARLLTAATNKPTSISKKWPYAAVSHPDARTLVILRLETARRQKPDAGIEFFAKGWN
jgi:hypothetical protein